MAAGRRRLSSTSAPTDLRVAATKSTDTDPVTVMDQRSQELILRLLAAGAPRRRRHG